MEVCFGEMRKCQVQDNLERIIPALEALPACQEPGDDQS